MNVESLKLELMQLLLQTQKESVLLKLKEVFSSESDDWWNSMDEDEQKEIVQGLSEADQGLFTNQETVMKRFDKWK